MAGKLYEIVSESLWEKLIELYVHDWAIERKVIAADKAEEDDEGEDDDTAKCVVEIQPLAYQVCRSLKCSPVMRLLIRYLGQIFEWRSGFNGPKVVQRNLPSGSKPRSLVVLASRKENVQDLMSSIVYESGIPRSHWEEFKALCSSEGTLSCQDKRVCLRSHAGAAWIPLARLLEKLKLSHSKPCFGTRSQGANKTLQRLESECTLGEIHEALEVVGGAPLMVDLLLEGQYGNKEKWRAGKFFSEIAQLVWRQELKPGDRLDALNKDTNTWQEASVDKINRNKIRVRYLGHQNMFSSMFPLDSDAIAPSYSRVVDWRRLLRVGDFVQIGLDVKYSKKVRWCEGKIVEISFGGDGVVKFEEGQDTRIHLLVDGEDDVWVSVDDDLICLPGTHELSPTPIKRERTESVITLADDEDEDVDEQASDGGCVAIDARKKRKRSPKAQNMKQEAMSADQIAAQLKAMAALHTKLSANALMLATQLLQLADQSAKQSEQGQTERESSESEEDPGFEVFMKPAGL